MGEIPIFAEWLATKDFDELAEFLVSMDIQPPEIEPHEKWRKTYLQTIEEYFLKNGLEKYLQQRGLTPEECFRTQNRLLLSFYDKMFKKQVSGWRKRLFKNEVEATSQWATLVLGHFSAMIHWAIKYKRDLENA